MSLCSLQFKLGVMDCNCKQSGGNSKAITRAIYCSGCERARPEHMNTLVQSSMNNFAKELDIDRRFLPSLDGHDFEVIKLCKGPREINRIVRSVIEKRMVNDRKKW